MSSRVYYYEKFTVRLILSTPTWGQGIQLTYQWWYTAV